MRSPAARSAAGWRNWPCSAFPTASPWPDTDRADLTKRSPASIVEEAVQAGVNASPGGPTEIPDDLKAAGPSTGAEPYGPVHPVGD